MINLSTSAFYERGTRQASSLRSEAEDLQRQIGSGNRLSKSSDDPVAAARLRVLERSQTLSKVDQRNSDYALADLKLTDHALSTAVNVVIRIQVLATQAANETLSEEQRATIGSEISMLQENLVVLANSRNASGAALFGGQTAGAAYDVIGGVATYAGTPTVEPVGLGDGQEVVPGLTGPEVFSVEVDGTPTDLFTILRDLGAVLQAGGASASAAASDALEALDAGLQKVSTAQSVVGARMGWIEVLDDRRVAVGELVAEEQGEVGGADIATTVTRLQELLTILEASQASFVRLSQLSLFDMIR